MKVDINKYTVNKKLAQSWYLEKGYKASENAISNIAIVYMVPCIVAAYWIGEVTEWPLFIRKSIISLKKFYQYGEISNKPDNTPDDL